MSHRMFYLGFCMSLFQPNDSTLAEDTTNLRWLWNVPTGICEHEWLHVVVCSSALFPADYKDHTDGSVHTGKSSRKMWRRSRRICTPVGCVAAIVGNWVATSNPNCNNKNLNKEAISARSPCSPHDLRAPVPTTLLKRGPGSVMFSLRFSQDVRRCPTKEHSKREQGVHSSLL